VAVIAGDSLGAALQSVNARAAILSPSLSYSPSSRSFSSASSWTRYRLSSLRPQTDTVDCAYAANDRRNREEKRKDEESERPQQVDGI
jgi:hypothetical protein